MKMSRIVLEEHSEELRAEITQALLPVLCRGPSTERAQRGLKVEYLKPHSHTEIRVLHYFLTCVLRLLNSIFQTKV